MAMRSREEKHPLNLVGGNEASPTYAVIFGEHGVDCAIRLFRENSSDLLAVPIPQAPTMIMVANIGANTATGALHATTVKRCCVALFSTSCFMLWR
jgi:hypothetical protein